MGQTVIEFRHRTDLLNAEAVCFLYDLTDYGLRQLRRVADFPEPSHFRMVSGSFRFEAPRKVVYWRRPVVDQYMKEVRLDQRRRDRKRRKRRKR